jgi:hypothetical protein
MYVLVIVFVWPLSGQTRPVCRCLCPLLLVVVRCCSLHGR